ncbi:heat shock 70 kDa protein 12A-like [Mytilus trossulus]|uniref:heat shock 70 kDa protein 12A-like n=1 Tax=Mytilus trossulus TaxID=6551 RepID=UPI0030051E2B
MAYAEVVSEPLLVAAIDFGTTFSGYAFQTREDFKEDPLMNQGFSWTTGSNAGLSLKTPTCVLFDPAQNFYSFGIEAEDKYTELAQEEDHANWYYFRRFKMNLYKCQEIPRDLMLEDDKGKLLPAMKVISESIKFMREHLMRTLSKKGQDVIRPTEINWVLTVPAIWSDAAKQFMREAAVKGGIPDRSIILALEPEAASIYCKYLPVDRTLSSGGRSTLDAFAPGTQYLLLDAGGGTVDITVQEIKDDGDIKQIYMANGGDWGGTKVDEAFDEFLTDIVGSDTVDKFRKDDKVDYLGLCREFEVKKRSIRPDSTAKITIRIPLSLSERFQEVKGVSLKSSFKSNKSMSWVGDKLRVDPDTAKKFFEEPCKRIVDHLKDLFQKGAVVDTDIILMVGGFSESQMLQEAIKSAFQSKTVIIPEDAGLAVLKGAVQFGFKPKVIVQRLSRYTHGTSTNMQFRPHTDPEDKKHIINDKMYCHDRFGKHVARGEPVQLGEVINKKTYNPLIGQSKIEIPIFSSGSEDPQYVDGKDCIYAGKFEVDLSDVRGPDREVEIRMIVSGPEVIAEAIIKSTGQKIKANFNCL